MQPEKQTAAESLDSQSIALYLSRNPDFFNQHSDVLGRLRIPHHTGAAVSLVEKQISVLRKKCNVLENKLSELIEVARDNEQLHQRLHVLIQDVISSKSLDQVCDLMKKSLIENFNADDVKMLFIDKPGSTRYQRQPSRFVAHDDLRLEMLEAGFESGQTICCIPNETLLDFLFSEEEQASVGSTAIIPLRHERNLGVAVLTSQDETRFDSDKGVMLLNQLGEVLSRRISAFI